MPATPPTKNRVVTEAEQEHPELFDSEGEPYGEATLPPAPSEREKMVATYATRERMATDALSATDEDFAAINVIKNEKVREAAMAEIAGTRADANAILAECAMFRHLEPFTPDDDRLERMMSAYNPPAREASNITSIRRGRGQNAVTTYASGDRLVQVAQLNGHIPAVATMKEGGVVEYGGRTFTSLSAAARQVKIDQDGETTKSGEPWSINGQKFWAVAVENVASR